MAVRSACSRGSLLVALLWAGVARAAPLDEALARFEAGEYEAVVGTLRAVVDAGEPADPVDRAQALRVYGIACVLTGRKVAAEGAFLLWLRLEPSARLDPSLVRPEVVDFFDDVRRRHVADLLLEVERHRPRSFALNLLPPAGQYQNGERAKFYVVLGLEVALLAVNLATGITLYTDRNGMDGTFADSERASNLRTLNWVSFGALMAVVVYGVIDGFAVYGRINRKLLRDENNLMRAASPSWRPSPSGLALEF